MLHYNIILLNLSVKTVEVLLSGKLDKNSEDITDKTLLLLLPPLFLFKSSLHNPARNVSMGREGASGGCRQRVGTE